MEARARGYDVTVPAGIYFLGDPCYAVPDEDWSALLESCNYFDCDGDGSPVGTMPDGQHVLGFGTAFGDGCYQDQHRTEFPVDAGLIGLVPQAVYERLPKDERERLDRFGAIVRFDHPTIATTDGEGRLQFGEYVINTHDDDEPGGCW